MAFPEVWLLWEIRREKVVDMGTECAVEDLGKDCVV